MKTVIQMSACEEAKALPILLRHSPGMVLPNRTYIVSEEAIRSLGSAGVTFCELPRGKQSGQKETKCHDHRIR